ncbi:malate synthase A [Temperatibacter marinus]|uniref:Malate synthase n=1 Tax=Temperatibacter marinus TaxID=1456591 RepID=A0AA52H9Z2_9PROT|nr:malate synthase A [Temperatibacter marinus]WND03429.1 malate synthase A [Temperatibacter marinus]
MTHALLDSITSNSLCIEGPIHAGYDKILTPQALDFIQQLERNFGQKRLDLMQKRQDRQKSFNQGTLPDFRKDTQSIRDESWHILGTPAELVNRTVEITGPVDRKMMINAFNSGANVFMADFEDASAPTWDSMINGQINMYDYARGMLSFADESRGKTYVMNEQTAILKVRPRGLHMEEKYITLDGQPLSAGFTDFGLHMYHNALALMQNPNPSIGGPFFYLPKLESYEEAALWNDVINYTEKALGIKHGTTKVTVLIETLPAAFEMDEILFALKDHIVGLNCGRWDYIFSYIKRIGCTNKAYQLPDRSQVLMSDAFLKAYCLLLIQTCHKRGAHAMGGMAAQIPVKGDDAKNQAAFDKVKADKVREVSIGHDGTWVAHPAMVDLAREAFESVMTGPNQLHRTRDEITISQQDLLEPHQGQATEEGLRENIRVGVQYTGAWLNGSGAVPINGLMEDAATAEISRTQIWQQLKFGTELKDGRCVTPALVERLFLQEMRTLKKDSIAIAQAGDRLEDASRLFLQMVLDTELAEFLTTPAYAEINEPNS